MAHTVYIRFTVFSNFSICSLFCTFFEISTPVMRIMLTMPNIVSIIISDRAHTVHIKFAVFSNFSICSLFCTFWLFRNLYSGDAHHVNYGKHSLNHHFRHGAHSVYKIYSVLKLFELLFLLNISTVSKLLLRWCASCWLCQT